MQASSVDISSPDAFAEVGIEEGESSSMLPKSATFGKESHRIRTKHRIPYLNLSLLIVNTLFILWNGLYGWQGFTRIHFLKHYCPDLPFSPKDTGIKYENSIMHLENAGNAFAGDLGPEVDKAWDDLLAWGNIRVSKEELSQAGELGDDSVALEDGGYMGTLRVFHELHCMNWIKREYSDLNKTFEDKDTTTQSGKYREEHFDHCLSLILQGVQCRADMTTSAWWIDETNMNKPLINRKNAVHTCVNWGTVENWIRPRLLSKEQKAVTPNGEKVGLEDLFILSKPT